MSYTQLLLEKIAHALSRGGLEFEEFRDRLHAEYVEKYKAKDEAEPPAVPPGRKPKR